MTNKYGIHCLISGKVQGVWYRASAQEEAQALGLTGFARNLPDGRVEVKAFGEKEKVIAFYQWLKKGPKLARVDEVNLMECDWEEFDRFGVR